MSLYLASGFKQLGVPHVSAPDLFFLAHNHIERHNLTLVQKSQEDTVLADFTRSFCGTRMEYSCWLRIGHLPTTVIQVEEREGQVYGMGFPGE